MIKKLKNKHWSLLKTSILVILSFLFIISGAILLWAATLKIPALDSFDQRVVSQSTKIYDKTGKVLLYDFGGDMKRTVVQFDSISPYIKDATISIEDVNFYNHKGFEPKAFLRAILTNIGAGGYSQGGSTITQQVIKNTLLTKDKTITRKLKEIFLAIKLEQIANKNTILGMYLNESPYGGNLYGVEEASFGYFGKSAKDVDIAEAAYLAALPQAPSYYSPYGSNRAKLDARKNLVLRKMLDYKKITQDEYDQAINEKVIFAQQESRSIKAPHFVFYIKDYLEKKYGQNVLDEGGLRITTTLDYNLQKIAEEIVKKYALENETKFKAKNAGLITLDAPTGQILVMVGSRDYFDKSIEGNFNITLAHRQPGSAFKPIVYAEAFNKGYLPDTVLFDVKTEFSTYCTPDGKLIDPKQASNSSSDCYMPENYDLKYRGPISLRNALAQSINIPAIKLLYLVGVKDSLQLAKDMGIESLTNPAQYGLTLVLGGGEVSPLELTSVYSVFANKGEKNTPTGILKIEDDQGKTLEEYKSQSTRVLPEQTALMITDVLSDNQAKIPAYGANSSLYFSGRDVASKTGTTNDTRDAWVIGYTPQIAVGAWVGNNDNSPMVKQVAGMIVAPMWNAFMTELLKTLPDEKFEKPLPVDETKMKPIIRGVWQGDQSYIINKSSGELATNMTPSELKEEKFINNIHSELFWIDRSDPLGPAPKNPADDPSFYLWEKPVLDWATKQNLINNQTPLGFDTVHTQDSIPNVSITTPTNLQILDIGTSFRVNLSLSSKYPITRADYYINNVFVGFSETSPFSFSFTPSDIDSILQDKINILKVKVKDSQYNEKEASINFLVR
ncbi:MAG: PBP1A family penicillin-binding protein [Candidatus Paceibacterota bacterium]